ncbi:hypothetical protein ACYFX5_23725 [Bremerella sp. T1]|uniref:hypothetical protein n=1 Tax=Bremerella sp. TYQ1 TaxID=3119568 RepID=UPI001CCEB0BB|nr:hypothetical protein [Bremerella volcania]UBM36040.1 hypothetical protein LA756_25670 [Bremerella volcania]
MYVLPMISAGQVLIAGIVSIVCFCMIIYRMFKADQIALPLICIVLAFFGFGGGIIAFVVGWIDVKKYDAMKVMVTWTIALVIFVGLLLSVPLWLPRPAPSYP